ncbi:unnamed protein product [Bursaphelenchus okinawaensis]|uniref:Uncharacterized protein n=1 Tax=Bursaphelenchus okinawaensis TaxID=465554 RepID=A0A811KSL3_9BILA|nr:unnamed protein product [Bursaphelenchus okinawaensis]CAG9110025.1 unnamed protein product [Bursaphelenchus okinawaensis]
MSYLAKDAICGQYQCSSDQRCVIKPDGEIIGCFYYTPVEMTKHDYFYYGFCVVYTMAMLFGMGIYKWKKFMKKPPMPHDPDIGVPPPLYQ